MNFDKPSQEVKENVMETREKILRKFRVSAGDFCSYLVRDGEMSREDAIKAMYEIMKPLEIRGGGIGFSSPEAIDKKIT